MGAADAADVEKIHLARRLVQGQICPQLIYSLTVARRRASD